MEDRTDEVQPYPIPLDQWRAVWDHSKLVEIYRAGIAAELARLRAPYEERVDGIWESIGQRPTTDHDRWALLIAIAPPESCEEVRDMAKAIGAGMAAYIRSNPPLDPDHTPAELVAYVDDALEADRIEQWAAAHTDTERDEPFLGGRPFEAYRLLLAWSRFAPCLLAFPIPNSGPRERLERIRAIAAVLATEPPPEKPKRRPRKPRNQR